MSEIRERGSGSRIAPVVIVDPRNSAKCEAEKSMEKVYCM
jgi:hypothetical protein